MRCEVAIAAGIVATLLALDATTAMADEPPPAEPNPLARDYVDIGLHGGPAWRGNVVDSRYSPFGVSAGATIDVGRAPYWGGIYSEVAQFDGQNGFVDPATNLPPRVRAISAGARAKLAIRLTPRLYLFPSLGAGFGRLDYSSGHYVISGGSNYCNCNTAAFDGFSVTGDATFAYVWRFGAVTFQPLRLTGLMFLSNQNAPHPAGYGYGVSPNGAVLAAAIGVSVDPAAMVLAIWDAVSALTPHGGKM